jgi:hypothetical protein
VFAYRAKLYKTAVVVNDIGEFKAGEIVAVEFVGRGSFALNFRIKLDQRCMVVTEFDLHSFVF